MASNVPPTAWWTCVGSWSYLDQDGEDISSVRTEYREFPVTGAAEIRRRTVGPGSDRLEVIQLKPGCWAKVVQHHPCGGWVGLKIEPIDAP
jgi:hypothetical protein